jgi:hypothetical protein
MSRIIIIGNGFDLGLGLKTGYNDFLGSEEFKELIQGGNILSIELSRQKNLHGWVDVESYLGVMGKNGGWSNCEAEYDALRECLQKYMALPESQWE